MISIFLFQIILENISQHAIFFGKILLQITDRILMFLIGLLFIVSVGCFQNYSKSNQSFTWPGQIVYNLMSPSTTISNSTDVPYFMIEDNGPGSVTFWYNFATTSSAKTGTPYWSNSEKYYIRSDSNLSVICDLDMNGVFYPINGVSNFEITMRLVLEYQGENGSIYSLHFIVMRWNKPYNWPSTGVIGGETFGYKLNNATLAYLLSVSERKTYKKAINILEVTQFLLSKNFINLTSYLTTIKYSFTFVGSGSFNATAPKLIPKRGYYKPFSKLLDSYQFSTFLFYPENRSSLDYSNLTASETLTSATQTLSDFRFYDTPHRLNAYHAVTIGKINGSYVTQPNLYALPILFTKNLVAFANFSFAVIDQNHQAAACIVIILSSNDNSTSSSAEIFICPYWSPSLSPSGTLLRIYQNGRKAYRLYHDYSLTKPTYTFIQTSSTLQNTDMELAWFLNTVAIHEVSLPNQTITALQAGFRFYVGKGTFRFEDIGFTVQTSKQTILGTISQYLFRNLVVVPNLSIIIKMLSMLRLIDDFSYYVYHRPRYDYGTIAFCQFSWNLTNVKWNIPQLDSIYEKFNISYIQYLPPTPTLNTPVTYLILSENSFFLKQTQDLWLRSLPLCIGTFAIGNLLYKIFIKFHITRGVAAIFHRFKFRSYLLVVFIGENLQYFTFRCFTQLYELKSDKRMLLNLIITYTVLFIVCFYAVSCYFMIPYFSPCVRRMLQGFKVRPRTLLCLILNNILRIIGGLAHSLFYASDISQTGTLLGIQLIALFLIIINRKNYLRKSLFACNIMEYLIRIVTHTFLLWQTLVVFSGNELSSFSKQKLSNVSDALFSSMFILCLADLIFDNLIGYEIQQKKSKQVMEKLGHIGNDYNTQINSILKAKVRKTKDKIAAKWKQHRMGKIMQLGKISYLRSVSSSKEETLGNEQPNKELQQSTYKLRRSRFLKKEVFQSKFVQKKKIARIKL